jgi:predicted secreted protein
MERARRFNPAGADISIQTSIMSGSMSVVRAVFVKKSLLSCYLLSPFAISSGPRRAGCSVSIRPVSLFHSIGD